MANIMVPADPKVTARKSTSVKIGNGDAPDLGLARPQSMTTNSAITGYAVKARRENLATDIAKKSTDDVAEITPGVVTRTDLDKIENVVRETWTTGKGKDKREHYRAVRTVDMGDAPLPTLTFPTGNAPTAAPMVPRTQSDNRVVARTAKAERDAEILAYLRERGFTGHLNSDIRALALDNMEHDRMLAEYASK